MTPSETISELPKKFPRMTPVLIGSGGFLLCVLLLTGYFWYRNASLDTAIETEKQHAIEYDASITTLKANSSVQAAEILAQAKPTIIRNIESSVVSNYIRELDRIHRDYLVRFSGFAYQPGQVATSVIAEKWLGDDAIRKVIKIIGDYRTGALSWSLMLGPVASVNGDEEKRSFGVEFKIK